MPYIKQEDRDKLEPLLSELAGRIADQPAGTLNYVITRLICARWNFKRCYQTANDIVGALQCAAMEFVRREVDEYENEKIAENGDVYGTQPQPARCKAGARCGECDECRRFRV